MDKRPKHIVLFIHSLQKGGAERVMANLAKELVKQEIRVTLVTQYIEKEEYPIPDEVNRIISEITPEETQKSRIGNFVARYKKLRRIFRELDPDLVLAFLGKNNLMAIAATLFTQIPVVVSVRSAPEKEYYTKVLRLAAKVLFPMADGIIFQTQEARDYFPKRARKKSVVLKNPLNAAFVKNRFTGERDGRIVSVGRFAPVKNHKMMLQAFAGIAEEFPETKLVLYGDGKLREELELYAGSLGVADRVKMPGVSDRVAEEIYTASAFLLASNHEGMPNALIEAMCMGIPSVSTDCPCGGPRDLIRHGENGFLVPVGDAKAMEECLRKLFSDYKLQEDIGIEASKMLNDFLPDKVNGEWLEYLLSKSR